MLNSAGHSELKPAIAQTLVALASLRLAFADRQAVWMRAAKKAVGMVMATLSVKAKDVEAWIIEIARRSRVA